MKNFCDIKLGDTVYLAEMKELKNPDKCVLKELKVIGVEEAANTSHLRVVLSDSTIITPSGVFPFHTITETRNDDDLSLFSPISEEIYATDKEECLRIASNTLKLKSKRIHNIINEGKRQLTKLDNFEFNIFELKKKMPTEVVTETVVI